MMYRLHAYGADGGNAQDTSVGEDRPDLINELYEESSKWIGLDGKK
jgi:hypothetical protein